MREMLAIFTGLAAAQVVQATGCSQAKAITAVREGLGIHSGEPPTSEGACQIVLYSIEVVKADQRREET